MAEYYSRNLAREVNKGMRENALKGLHTGGLPPLGYDVDPLTKKLIINEREAVAVRLIFKMFIEGFGYDKIINELNLQDFKTKLGKHFGHNSLHSIIRNEKYTGVFIFNKLASKDMDGKRNGNSFKEPEEIIRLEGAVPAIIPKEEFEMAQNIILSRKQVRAANNAVEKYLLSGKIFCGECGGAYVGNRKLSGRNKTLQVTYRCSVRKSKHICKNKDIRKDYIETFVLERLSYYVFNTALIPKLIYEYTQFETEKNSVGIKKQENLKKRIAEIKKEISNLLLLATKVASESLALKLEELEREKCLIQEQLEQLCNEVNSNRISIETFSEAFNKAYSNLRDGSLAATKSIVEIFVDKVFIYENYVKIMFKNNSELNNIPACL